MSQQKVYPKKFYQKAEVDYSNGRYIIKLDGRVVKTPARNELFLPNKFLADAIMNEWNLQEEVINPETMLLTKLANTAIDRVQPRKPEIVDELAKYLASDLLCYRAESPQELNEKQSLHWDPVLKWAGEKYNIQLVHTQGIVHVEQSDEAVENAKLYFNGLDAFLLSGLHNMTTLLGSALLSMAVANRFIGSSKAWELAHIDEDWQIEQWGTDEEAQQRRITRFKEMESIAEYIELTCSETN